MVHGSECDAGESLQNEMPFLTSLLIYYEIYFKSPDLLPVFKLALPNVGSGHRF